MLAYTFYENDNRVRRYAETLVKRGIHVDAIALRQEGQACFTAINGVSVYRIQKRIIDEKGRWSYLFKLLRFFVKSAILVTKKHLQNPYALIHVHSVPDFEVFAAGPAKLLGAKIILDIHDLVPEFYVSKFDASENSFLYRVLILVEKASIAFSDHIIISNHIWQKTLSARSVREKKCSVILNYPDLSIFYKRPREGRNGKFVIIYPGTLNWHQGLDIAIKAFALIKEQAPDLEFRIYGDGSERNSLVRLVAELGLEDRIFFKGLMPLDEIANVMATADLGVVPKRKDSFGNEAFSTKILEFMAQGIPVIVADTKIDKFYFDESMVKFFASEDEIDLAHSILVLKKDCALRERLIQNAFQYIKENNWEIKKAQYLLLVDSLTAKKNGKYFGSTL
jgi:glycosyltransferase involved in cell wall biosynthesis